MQGRSSQSVLITAQGYKYCEMGLFRVACMNAVEAIPYSREYKYRYL